MALVPSGRIRVMVAQTLTQNKPNQLDVGDAPVNDNGTGVQEAPAPRLDVEQEQLQPQEVQQEAAPEIPEVPQQAEAPEEPQAENEEEESGLRASWKKVMIDLGLEERQIDQSSSELFKETVNITDSTINGFFHIPTYTMKAKISQRKALEIAQALFRKFNLSGELMNEKTKKNGKEQWKVIFKSAPKPEIQQGSGSSFDGIGSGNDGNSSEMNRNASTIGEMIKDRRDELYNIMRKIAERN